MDDGTLLWALFLLYMLFGGFLWPLLRIRLLNTRPRVKGKIIDIRRRDEDTIVVYTFFFEDVEFEVEEILTTMESPRINSKVTVTVNPKAVFDSTIMPSFSKLSTINDIVIILIIIAKILNDIFLKNNVKS